MRRQCAASMLNDAKRRRIRPEDGSTLAPTSASSALREAFALLWAPRKSQSAAVLGRGWCRRPAPQPADAKRWGERRQTPSPRPHWPRRQRGASLMMGRTATHTYLSCLHLSFRFLLVFLVAPCNVCATGCLSPLHLSPISTVRGSPTAYVVWHSYNTYFVSSKFTPCLTATSAAAAPVTFLLIAPIPVTSG